MPGTGHDKVLGILLGLVAAGVCSAAGPYDSDVKPFLRSNCVACHSGEKAAAGLDLNRFLSLDESDALASRKQWELVSRKLASGEMPPPGIPRPAADKIAALRAWVTDAYRQRDAAATANPGRVTARRLNRFEYNNTIYDLFGVAFHPADDFPADDSGYGFDNIGDVLSVSPSLMDKYLRAAELISETVVPAPTARTASTVERYLAERIGQYPRLREEFTHRFPADGEYQFRTTWYQKMPNGMPIECRFFVDGKEATTVRLNVSEEMDRAFQTQIFVPFGSHRISAQIRVLDPQYRRAMPYIEYTEIQGPKIQRQSGPPEAYRRVFICGHDPGHHSPSCARRILAPLAARAWRRPLTNQEVDPLLQVVSASEKRGESFEQSIGVALRAILVSPYFLFRIEADAPQGGPRQLNDYELAARLSYFLWSSTPDEELLKLAALGKLHDKTTMETQIQRMLADSKSHRLLEAFGGQWLQIRNLDVLTPDAQKFPEYDEDLRDSMKTETQMFLGAFIEEDRSLLDLLDAPFTYLNARLARHYGIPGVAGEEFRRVALEGSQRGGVLTQASVLTVSSYPTRTSPVIRGKWILENILGAPPPPPPPDVPPLDEASVGSQVTLRQQLEKHRSNAVCASCHSRMDPLGFGLENYDALGKWRTQDGKLPIDAGGTLPNGKTFNTPSELKTMLRSDEHDAFVHCLTQKLLTFALGRGLEDFDQAAVNQIATRAAAGGYHFSTLIREIVASAPFQQRAAASTKN
jgi:hypothetical protein